MVMGVPSLVEMFDESNYADLAGGILESFGRLFKNELKLFVYPMLRDDEVVTVDNARRSATSCSRSTTTSTGAAASSTWTTTSRSTCRS